MRKKVKCVNFNESDEYYGDMMKTNGNLGFFIRYLQNCGIKGSYTTLRMPK